jgi:hypothetical protein
MFGGAVATDGGCALGSLIAGDVSRIMTRSCAHPVRMSPRELVSALRSFLRFSPMEGVIESPLADAVPSVRLMEGGWLPKALRPLVDGSSVSRDANGAAPWAAGMTPSCCC